MTVSVRLAKLTDLSDILAFAKRRLETTNYAEFPFNAVLARQTVKRSMLDANARVWVSVRDGSIAGVLIGEVGPMTFTHQMCATDTVFLANAGGQLLLRAFLAWCKLRKVARIDMGISAGEERRGVARLFKREGFESSGSMFHMNCLPRGEP